MKTKLLIFIIALGLIGAGVYWYLRPVPSVGHVYRQVPHSALPGWQTAKLVKSLLAFQTSCRAFVKQDPERVVGTEHIELKAKDWHPACRAALKIHSHSESKARAFFEKWFVPVEFFDQQPVKGLFTGYYMPLLKGSYKRTQEFNVPLYESPKDMVTIDLGLFIPHLKNKKLIGRLVGKRILPYFTRQEINNGAIKKTAKVLVWVNSPVDRLFLEIQGSGIIKFKNGKQILVGYDSQNGAPYTSIAGVLINKGVMTRDNASMQKIKSYLEAHPGQMDKVINQNQSFVFFRKLNMNAAQGSQGVALTPGYSMAIDRAWVPMGAPVWLSTTRPDSHEPDKNKPFQRLMVAQDTGGAIKGKVRGDVFWGGGNHATSIAGHMKNEGHYWMFIPQQALSRIVLLTQ